MKRLIVIFLMLAGAANTVIATDVCGDVSGTLTLAGSPYIITCNATVPSGQSLTIQPGVRVLFGGNFSLAVYGRFTAIGTEEDSIYFGPATDTELSKGSVRFVSNPDTCRLKYCIFDRGLSQGPGLSSGWGGGFLAEFIPAIYVERCSFFDNHGVDDAGGAGIHFVNYALVSHCVFAGNSAGTESGGLQLWTGGNADVINCIFYNNSGTVSALTLAQPGTVWNCIVWANTGNPLAADTVRYSDIQGGYADVGNISSDPLFVDATNGDFHLQASSPCIDAGDPNSPLDPDGTIADMGAFPRLQYTICPPTPIPFLENFDSLELDSCWTWIREDTSHWSLTERPGWMRLVTNAGNIHCAQSHNILLRPRPESDFQVETQLAINPQVEWQQGGLSIWRTDGVSCHVTRTATNRIVFQVYDELCGGSPVFYEPVTQDTVVSLRMAVHGDTVSAYWSSDAVSWEYIGTAVRTWLLNSTVRVGIYSAEGGYDTPDIPADFDYLRVDSIPPPISIEVISPNGGEEWNVFHNDTVFWSSSGVASPIAIELNRDFPSGEWEVLADSTENDGEFEWFVTDPLSDNCRIRVSAVEDTFSDISDGDFSITSSQGYLALARESSPNSPVLAWNAGTVECPDVESELYRLKNFGSEAIVVFQPEEPASGEFSHVTTCGAFFALAPGQMSTCSLTLAFDPASDGQYFDTLLIQTDAVNQQGGYIRIPLAGEQISTPATPQVVITIEDQDAVLNWSAVTESIGGCPVIVTGYLVFYSPTSEGTYYYHGFTSDTTYTHVRAAQFTETMFYQVVAYTGEVNWAGLEEGMEMEAALEAMSEER